MSVDREGEGVSSGTSCTEAGLRDIQLQPDLTSSIPIPSSDSTSSLPSASSDPECVADADPWSHRKSITYMILYKQGDDIRQDEIATQLIRFMDFALKGQGLDLRLITYNVLSLGPSEVPLK